MGEPLTPEAMAELLRSADFALEHSTASLIAFTTLNHIVTRDAERNDEVRRQIKVALESLPPEPPLTPEQEAECAEVIGRVLDGLAGGDTNG